jgi:hypothetical protein
VDDLDAIDLDYVERLGLTDAQLRHLLQHADHGDRGEPVWLRYRFDQLLAEVGWVRPTGCSPTPALRTGPAVALVFSSRPGATEICCG